MGLFLLWFSLSRDVRRAAYAASGFGLMAFKYGVEAGLIFFYTFIRRIWMVICAAVAANFGSSHCPTVGHGWKAALGTSLKCTRKTTGRYGPISASTGFIVAC
ncbi:MAG: hypothetical protein ABI614_00765 [Planctomycetota bacterium]